MKKRNYIALTTVLLALGLVACGEKKSTQPATSTPAPTSTVAPTSQEAGSSQAGQTSSQGGQSSSAATSSASTEKSVTITENVLVKEDNKVYVKVSGTQQNYSAADFKWAWGIKVNGDNGAFVYGSATPVAADYAAVTFDANKAFTVKLCLTDITTGLTAGEFYRIFGGTAETYADIAFTDSQTGARDQARNYYLRNDQNGSLVFDNVLPIPFTKASVVNVAAADLPDGATATQEGVYVKVGGENVNNLTEAQIKEWDDAGKLAGHFQRCIDNDRAQGYARHDIPKTERFWKVEGTDVYLYFYVGFITEKQGWQTHFDMVSGNAGANFNMDVVLKGDQDFVVNGATYRLFADTSKGANQGDYYGCLGIYRAHIHDYQETKRVANSDGKDMFIKECSCGDKYIGMEFKDYSAISATPNGTNPWYLAKGSNVTWKINVDKAITGAKIQFGMIASSSDHLGRHLYNEWKEDKAHEGEEGYVKQNTAGTPDKETEDDWRYSIAVGDTAYPITNRKTMAENGAKQNVLTYVELATIDLAMGENVLKLSQNNIGYRMKFNGEVRIFYSGSATISGETVTPKVDFQTWDAAAIKAGLSNGGSTEAVDTSATPFTAYKVGTANDTLTLSYTATAATAGKATLKVLFTTKSPNAASCGFWRHPSNSNVKTEITFNTVKLDTPADNAALSDLGASAVSETAKEGTTALYMPVWFEAIELTLVEGVNTIELKYMGGGYSYWVAGAALAR